LNLTSTFVEIGHECTLKLLIALSFNYKNISTMMHL
jgi:hypothetical protein